MAVSQSPKSVSVWFWKAWLAVSLALALAACGGGGSSDNPAGATVSVNGVVIDGPLAGVRVCLDLNADKACGAQEPSAISGPDGGFSMVVAEPALERPWPLVAEVDAAVAQDSDDGGITLATAGKRSVVLTGFADAGSNAVVSPLATLVVNRMERLGLKRSEAAAQVAGAFGIPPAADLFADYTQASDPLSRRLHNAARVAFLVQGEVEAGFEMAEPGWRSPVRHRTTVAVAEQRAAELIAALGVGETNIAELQALVQAEIAAERFAYRPDVAARIVELGATRLPASAMIGQTVTVLNRRQQIPAGFQATEVAFSDAVRRSSRLWVDGQWTDETIEPVDQELDLATGQWRDVPVVGRLGGFSAAAGGDGVLTFDHSGVRVGLSFERVDLAGQEVGRLNSLAGRAVAPLDGAAESGVRFPEGSALVRYRVTYLDDSEWVRSSPYYPDMSIASLLAGYPTPDPLPTRKSDLGPTATIGLSAVTFAGDAVSGTVTSWMWHVLDFPEFADALSSHTARYDITSRGGYRMLEVSGLGMCGVYARYCGYEPGGDGILVERSGNLHYGALERAGTSYVENRRSPPGMPPLGHVGLNSIAWETVRQFNGLP